MKHFNLPHARHHSHLRMLSALLFCWAITGCGLIRENPGKLSYLLDVKRPGQPRASSGTATLRVAGFRVASPYEGRGFVYRRGPVNYETDFYHEFLVSPRDLFAEEVREWMDASRLFAVTVDPRSRLETTHLLEGNISLLYGDFAEESSPKAVLAMRFFLLTGREKGAAIIFQKEYREEISVHGPTPGALVEGWSVALEAVLTGLEADLGSLALE